MHDIVISRTHKLPPAEARVAAEHLAAQLKQEFDMMCDWSGNTLRFTRAGVSGELVLQEGEVCIQVKLSFLLQALKSHIEAEINRHFDENFGH